MFGLWLSCSYQGCGIPAVFQLRSLKNGQEIMAHFCPIHLLEAQNALQEMEVLRKEDAQHLLERENG